MHVSSKKGKFKWRGRDEIVYQGSVQCAVLRTAGALGLDTFLVLSSEKAEMTSLEEITKLDINELEGVDEEGISPESSKVELGAKV